jgi:hypothetical protein
VVVGNLSTWLYICPSPSIMGVLWEKSIYLSVYLLIRVVSCGALVFNKAKP